MIYFFLFLFSVLTSFSSYTPEGIDDRSFSKLSLREKIGQLCFAAVAINETVDKELMDYWFQWQPKYQINRQYVEKLIKECDIGGIVFYGKYAQPEEAINLNHYFQSISKIPLLVTIDAEWGLGMRLNDKFVQTYPRNGTLGAIQNFDLIYQLGYEIGLQLKLLGVHVNFAPVVDINNNPDNPVIGMRAFGSDKEHVARMGISYMQGLQDAGIIACAKHFPGHGDTSVDSHLELPLIKHTLEHLYNNELYPFKRLIDAGIKSVMTAHLEIPALENEIGLPSSLSKTIVTDVLQKEMGFNGLIFTDALGMKGVADHFPPGEGELKALLAGNDILLCPLDVKQVIDRIEKAVLQKEISIEEIDRKVLKVLAAKKWALTQVLEPEDDVAARLNSIEARALRRTLYRNAITSIKSEPNFIEKLAKTKTVVINTDPELTAFEDILRKTSSFALLRHSFKEPAMHLPALSQEPSDQFNVAIEEAANVIISVSKNSFVENSDHRLLIDLIQEIKSKVKNVTLVLFCSPYLLPILNQADNVIQAYETVEDAQISAGKLFRSI